MFFVACKNTNTKNNPEAISDKITEQEYDWVIDSVTYIRANSYAYAECKATDAQAYTECKKTDAQAYSECKATDAQAYTEFHKSLLVIEGKLQQNDLVAYNAYSQEVKEENKKHSMTTASFDVEELHSKFPKSLALKEFYNAFLEIEKTRDAIYEKAEQLKQEKYDKAEQLKQSKYEKAEQLKQEKYEVILSCYSKVKEKK